jgi:hypothetical protein
VDRLLRGGRLGQWFECPVNIMQTINGWLFDVYPNKANLTVWVIGDDGKRHCFAQDFAATVYAAAACLRH